MLKTYVSYKGKMFFVSTIKRQSSIFGHGETFFDETVVTEIDSDTKRRIKDLFYSEGGIEKHFDLCKQLHEKGEIK